MNPDRLRTLIESGNDKSKRPSFVRVLGALVAFSSDPNLTIEQYMLNVRMEHEEELNRTGLRFTQTIASSLDNLEEFLKKHASELEIK